MLIFKIKPLKCHDLSQFLETYGSEDKIGNHIFIVNEKRAILC